ncbi:MAG: YerC/YecD family TrpR-related protein [Clostridia bacterium]|nr:YerC/YecD family TrpR-related protein [Clostridia bacterium]
MDKIRNEETDRLMQAVLKLKNIDECYAFFEDVCTIKEIRSMSQRLSVAEMLDKKMIYTDIAAATGASTVTISRVARCLSFGQDGYRLIIDRLNGKDD